MREESASVYYVARRPKSCQDKDCTRYTLKPFTEKKLVLIEPAPADDDKKMAEQAAKVELQQQLTDQYQELKALEEAGNLIAHVLRRLMKGVGGNETCKQYNKDCECYPDMKKKPPAKTFKSIPIRVTVPFESGGKKYKAQFDLFCELDVVYGKCSEPI